MLTAGARQEPDRCCPLCARLVAFRAHNRREHADWHNAPVASFGDPEAAFLIVGLAPGRGGANRTGRPFTGDWAGELLYPTLLRFGFARGDYRAAPDDGLELVGCRITNAVRCVPPENKPTGAEVRTCRQFLNDQLLAPPAPRLVLPLGQIAHLSVLRVLGLRAGEYPFRHGACYRPAGAPAIAPSYHCSRYNVNTGRLTPAMFESVVARARDLLAAA